MRIRGRVGDGEWMNHREGPKSAKKKSHAGWAWPTFFAFAMVSAPPTLFPAICFAGPETSSSALTSETMDHQLSSLDVQGGLLDVMKAVEMQSGVRLEAGPAVWEALPWGQDTSLTVHVQHTTLRQALDSITRHLGLTYRLGDEAVLLSPSPALARIGRRATLDEIGILELLASQPIKLDSTEVTVDTMLAAVDARLTELKSVFAIQRRPTKFEPASIHIARNATMMEALEEVSAQTDATWYPWGHTLVITSKVDAVRLRLGKRLSRRFDAVPLSQVLLDLSEFSCVDFIYTPGVLNSAPAEYQNVTLNVEDASVQQTLEQISGRTGLKFEVTEMGVRVTGSGAAARVGQ